MLQDGLLLVDGAPAVNFQIASGTSFPTDTSNLGELFYLTGGTPALYVYDGSTWQLTGSGGAGTFTITGDVTGTIDGGTDVLTLESVGTAGTFGSASLIPIVTVDSKGRVTSVSTTSVNGFNPASNQIISGSWQFSNAIQIGTPTIDSHAATKSYVDSIAAGLNVKASVKVATTANITLSNTQTIDGVAVAIGDRVLVKDQSVGTQNGIYVVASGAWTRAIDFDGTPTSEVTSGSYTLATQGTTQSATGFVLITNDPITLGSTAQVWSAFQAASSYTAGSGISITGNVIANTAPGISGTNISFNDTTAALKLGQDGGSVSGILTSGDGLGLSIYPATYAGVTPGANVTITGGQSSRRGGDVVIQGGQENLNGYGAGNVFISGGTGFGGGGEGGTLTLSGGIGNAPGGLVFRTNNTTRANFNATGSLSFGASGTAFGTAGQVLTSTGDAPPSWQTVATSAAAAGTLSGSTLASNVVFSSLTSVGILTNLVVNNTISGPSGNGTTLTVSGGAAGGSSQGGGNVTIAGAVGWSDNSQPGSGGSVIIAGGQAGNSASGNPSGGSVTIIAGAGFNSASSGTSTGGTGASTTIGAGAGGAGGATSGPGGVGGNLILKGGQGGNGVTGGAAGPGGSIQFQVSQSNGAPTTALTISNSGQVSAASTIVAPAFSGSGASLSNITNTNLIGTNGTSGQVLTNTGAGAAPTWQTATAAAAATIANATTAGTTNAAFSLTGVSGTGTTNTFTLQGGASSATTAPGNTSLIGGTNSASASGVGGIVTIAGGAATTNGGTGGAVSIAGGNAQLGGAVTIGNGTSTGTGGNTTITSGTPTTGSGAKAGDINIAPGSPISGNGASLSLAGGAGVAIGSSRNGGPVNINGGSSGAFAGSVGGSVTIAAGVASIGTGTGGDLILQTGATISLTDRLRITNTGAWTVSGVAATAGQVLTTVTVGAAPTWQTPAVAGSFNGGTITTALVIDAALPQLTLGSATSGTSRIINTASSAGAGQAIQLVGANATSGAGSNVILIGGAGSGVNTGGVINLSAGNSGAASTYDSVLINGAVNTGSGRGGSIAINSGTTSAGTGGDIYFTTGSGSSFASTERFRILANGAWSVGSTGTATGTSGQVLTSAGNAAPTWQTASGAAGTLTGATLASNVLASSLTSVGTLTSLAVTGNVTSADPTISTHLTTKQYVDTMVQGLTWKTAARVASTVNLTLSGTQTIDGVAVVAGNRVLAKNQTTASQNGVYVVAAGAWTRSVDMDGAPSVGEVNGAAVYITDGTTLADTSWSQSADVVVMGTSPLTFVQFSGAGTTNASSLIGTTLAPSIVTSSLTSVGTLSSLAVTGAVTAGSFVGPLTGAASLNVLKTGDTMTGGLVTSIGGGTASATKHLSATNGAAELFFVPRNIAGGYNGLSQLNDAYIGFQTNGLETGSLVIGPSSAVAKGMRIDSAGNVTIAAPSSGAALTLGGNGTGTTQFMNVTGATTGALYADLTNTSGVLRLGTEGSAGNTLLTGAPAYATVIGSTSVQSLSLGTNGTERMRIAAAGNVTINTPTSGVALTVNGQTTIASAGSPWFLMGAGSTAASFGAFHRGGTSTPVGYIGTDGGGIAGGGTGDAFGIRSEGALLLMSGAAERVRITAAGDLLVGTASTSVTSNGVIIGSVAANSIITMQQAGTGALTALAWYRGGSGTASGSISTTSTATSYNTTSDARLKKNIVDAPSATAAVSALEVRSFDWNIDDTHTEFGFIAQELVTVAPSAVTQGDSWTIDPSKLIPMLTKALQEALTEIDSLKARVASLEI